MLVKGVHYLTLKERKKIKKLLNGETVFGCLITQINADFRYVGSLVLHPNASTSYMCVIDRDTLKTYTKPINSNDILNIELKIETKEDTIEFDIR